MRWAVRGSGRRSSPSPLVGEGGGKAKLLGAALMSSCHRRRRRCGCRRLCRRCRCPRDSMGGRGTYHRGQRERERERERDACVRTTEGILVRHSCDPILYRFRSFSVALCSSLFPHTVTILSLLSLRSIILLSDPLTTSLTTWSRELRAASQKARPRRQGIQRGRRRYLHSPLLRGWLYTCRE